MAYEDQPSNEVGAYNPEYALKQTHDPRMPIRRKLEIKLELVRKEAAELENAIKALDTNPEFEKLHDTLTRVSRFL